MKMGDEMLHFGAKGAKPPYCPQLYSALTSDKRLRQWKTHFDQDTLDAALLSTATFFQNEC